MFYPIDDKLERLISRVLDGEATPAECADLRQQMTVNPAMQALYDDYARADADARLALHSVLIPAPLESASTPPPAHAFARRGSRNSLPKIIRLATGIGIMAAAAAIGFVLSPSISTGPAPVRPWPPAAAAPEQVTVARGVEQPTFVSDEAVDKRETWRRLMPHRDFSEVRQDWIGVYDNQTRRTFLFGMDRRGTRSVPIVYEN